jgi:hypothetical protein
MSSRWAQREEARARREASAAIMTVLAALTTYRLLRFDDERPRVSPA